MAVRGNYSVYLYDPLTSAVTEYGRSMEHVRWTNLSPGGYGQFEAQVKLTNPALLASNLTLFSRLIVKDPSVPEPHQCRFLGELSEPELTLSESEGEFIKIIALGYGAGGLRDDPDTHSWNALSPKTIIANEFTAGNRPNYLLLDPDQTAVFPDNPALTFSPSYTSNTIEEVVADMVVKSGDYAWGVWAHAQNRDSLGFPTGQLYVHQRDKSTVTYSAYSTDMISLRLKPNMSRCINVVDIGYNDPTQNPPVGRVTYTDPRLAANGSQGTAPFRRRKYSRELAGISTASKTQAQAIANAQGALWQNIGFTTEIVLRTVRDGNGTRIPIWQVQADTNIFLPFLTRVANAFVRATALPTSPTYGINLFYIRLAEYSESGNDQRLTLQLDNFYDSTEAVLSRLQLRADEVARIAQKTTGVAQAPGAPMQGQCGGAQQASGTGQTVGMSAQYPATAQQTPTSITITGTVQSTNVSTGTQGVSDITTLGFLFFWVSAGSGQTTLVDTYTTVGNTLEDVDLDAGTFSHHCQVCETRLRAVHDCRPGCVACREGATRRGLAIVTEAVFQRNDDPDARPGTTGLAVFCPVPACGASEHYNTALAATDELAIVRGTHSAGQAAAIRRILEHHHTHGTEGAHTIETWRAAQASKKGRAA